MPNKKCEHCGRALVAIGRDRENGKQSHDDWSTRKYHKKCWKEVQEAEEADAFEEMCLRMEQWRKDEILRLSTSMRKLSPSLLELPK